jgi:hypothetical protein
LGMFKVGGLLLGEKKSGGAFIGTFVGTIDTANTYKNTYKALPGSLLISMTDGKIYINAASKANPNWTIVGSQT